MEILNTHTKITLQITYLKRVLANLNIGGFLVGPKPVSLST